MPASLRKSFTACEQFPRCRRTEKEQPASPLPQRRKRVRHPVDRVHVKRIDDALGLVEEGDPSKDIGMLRSRSIRKKWLSHARRSSPEKPRFGANQLRVPVRRIN